MSLLALTTLFSGPNQTGSSTLFGLGVGDRYNYLTHDRLDSLGLLDSVASGSMVCKNADLNLIFFSNPDYTGSFFQLSKTKGGDATFWHAGPAQSALLIASNNQGTSEHRVGYVETFQSQWDMIVDQQLEGTSVSRDVEPLLTWRMFPTDDQWLDSSQVYLRIHQPLHVHMPWYWPDYQASMDYHIVLFINGDGNLRAWVADWEYWVESGAKSHKIGDQLGPQVEAGMQPLEDNVNAKLEVTDALGQLKDVYYLPGNQIAPIENAGFGGNTSQDVTIVVVS
jgi:hypothetical protein